MKEWTRKQSMHMLTNSNRFGFMAIMTNLAGNSVTSSLSGGGEENPYWEKCIHTGMKPEKRMSSIEVSGLTNKPCRKEKNRTTGLQAIILGLFMD